MSENVLAKAVYDNIAETADELEFRRGDIVTVIEQNTAGLEGWWLCSLNGRQGIAPGNRLRLIPMMYGQVPQRANPALFNGDDEDEEYDIPKHQYPNQNNNNNDPNEVYDVPTSRHWGSRTELDDEDETYDVPPPPKQPPSLKSSTENLLSSPQHRTVQIEQEVYDIPSNLVAPGTPNVTFNEHDPSEVYDVPPSRELQEDVYDVPMSTKVSDAVPLDVSALLEQQEEEEDDEVYDVPPSRMGNDTVDGILPMFHTSTPSSHNASADLPSPDIIYDIPKASKRFENSRMDDSLNLSNFSTSSTRFSPGNKSLLKQDSEDYVYDVPPQVTKDQPPPKMQSSANEDLEVVIKRLSLVGADDQAERRSTSSVESLSSIIAANARYTELNLELSSAIDKLIKLKQSLEDSVSNLLTHVFEGWREKQNISGKIGVIKEVFETVIASVVQFVEFSRGAMANAHAAHERGLTSSTPRVLITGMHKLLQPLEEDNLMLQQANDALNQACWSLSKLVLNEASAGVPDEVDSFVMTSRAVSDDSRQMAAFIHTHSQYLFKRVAPVARRTSEIIREQKVLQARPLPTVPPQQQHQNAVVHSPQQQQRNEETWLEDYDYVSLEEQDELDNSRSSNPTIGISPEVRTRHQEVLQVLEMSNQQHGVPLIIGMEQNGGDGVHSDQFTLQDMVEDVPLLVESLVSAIKQFYASIDNSDPPKTFVSLSKQVILCAHELVFFGDTLYRRLNHHQMQEIVKGHCAELCTSLKRTVAATKHAAQQWPSVPAVQEMVNRVTDITASAHQFRVLLSQCSVR